MSKPGTILAPQGRNLSDMLEILADPVQYRKHLDELRAKHKEIDDRLGLLTNLEKIQAYHKQVKNEAAQVSKSRKDVEAALAKLEQATKDLAASKVEFAASRVAHDEEHAARMASLARDISAHLAVVQEHEDSAAVLKLAQDKLANDMARHDARVLKAKEKLAGVVQAIKGVEAL